MSDNPNRLGPRPGMHVVVVLYFPLQQDSTHIKFLRERARGRGLKDRLSALCERVKDGLAMFMRGEGEADEADEPSSLGVPSGCVNRCAFTFLMSFPCLSAIPCCFL